MAETQPNQEWYQGVNLIGATGDVASEYIRRATEEDYPKGEHWPNSELKPEHNPINHQHPTKITALANSTRYLVDLNGIKVDELRDDRFVTDIINQPEIQKKINEAQDPEAERERQIIKANVATLLKEDGQEYDNPAEIAEAVKKQVEAAIARDGESPISLENMVYVDAAVGNLKPLYEAALESGSSVLAVNKDTLANLTLEEFQRFIANGKLEFKATVGAGAEAVDICLKAAESPRPVVEITATLSGTCGKLSNILSSPEYLNGDREFDDIVRQLHRDKDTEPNPHTDLSGADVMKKIIILALASGYDVKLSDIKPENPIVPEQYGEIDNVDDYLDALSDHNQAIRDLATKAQEAGKVVRYVARMKVDEKGDAKITVELEQINPEGTSPDAKIAAAQDNIMYLRNATQPRFMEKPGSGLGVTAEAIQDGLKDLVGPGNQRRAA